MALRRELDVRPLDRARNLPASAYCEPGLTAIEDAAVFGDSWQLVGHDGLVPEPGSYHVTEHAGRPLVLTRDVVGEVHALANVCRHRGGPVAVGAGCARELQCRYHGWRYALDGQLREAPGFGEPQGFDPARVRLPALVLLRWRGLHFAHRQAGAGAETLAEELTRRLAKVDEVLGSGHDSRRYRFDRRVVYEAACNWKLYVDNYLEGYHVPLVHPGLQEQLHFEAYATELFDGFSLQSSPLDAAVTAGGGAVGDARYVHLFPNLMLNCLPGRLQTNVVLPDGVDRCRIVFDYFYGDEVSVADRANDQASAHETQLEDIEICEQVQRNLRSGAYVSGRLSPTWESALWAFQNRWRELVRASV